MAMVVPQERVQQRALLQEVDEPVPRERAVQLTAEQFVHVPGPQILMSSAKLVRQEREQRNFVGHSSQHRDAAPTSVPHERVQRQTARQVGDVHGPQFWDLSPDRLCASSCGAKRQVAPSARERVLAELAAAGAEAEVVDDTEGMMEEFDEFVDCFKLSRWRPKRLCRCCLDRGCTRGWECRFARGEQEPAMVKFFCRVFFVITDLVFLCAVYRTFSRPFCPNFRFCSARVHLLARRRALLNSHTRRIAMRLVFGAGPRRVI